MQTQPDHLSPARFRRVALVMVGLAGAATGLFGGVGWRLFADGDHDLAVAMWGLAAIAVAALLVVAMLARAVAALAERTRSNSVAAIRRLEEELARTRREVADLRRAVTIAAVAEPDALVDGSSITPRG